MRQARQDELGKAFALEMPLDFVRLGRVVAERRAEAHLGATARGHDSLVQSLAARGTRTGTADQRLAGFGRVGQFATTLLDLFVGAQPQHFFGNAKRNGHRVRQIDPVR